MTGSGREESANAPRAEATNSGDRARVWVLEQTLWKRLSEAAETGAFADAWLALQCRKIPGVVRGVVVLGSADDGPFAPVAYWPEGQAGTPRLSSVAEQAMAERQGVVHGHQTEQQSADGPSAAIAYPVLVDEQLHGVVALELDSDDGLQLRDAMRQLQWGATWLRERLRQELGEAQEQVLDRTTSALDLVATALQEERFAAACQAAVTELARRTSCDRVSVGFVVRGHSTVAKISHSAQFGKRMNLVRMLGSAMDEAIDQQVVVLYPAGEADDVIVNRAHAELAHAHGSGNILTVPMFVQDRFVGALTFERPAARPFDQAAVDLLDCVVAVIGPILEEKRCNDRWIGVKLGESLARQARRLLGPGHIARKLAVAGALAVVLFFYFAVADYRVTAVAAIEGLVQRSVVASFDGFVRLAPVRAGDTVEQGQLLAALDDRDLALERLRWVTERQRRVYEYAQALGARQRAETNIAKTHIEQAEAQIRLIDKQLERAKLHAPFDGLVVAGDLSQSIGAAVRRGEVLFQIAPLAAYRVILWVDEGEIAQVEIGQRGHLVAAALPHESYPFVVETITPVAEAREGRNVFRVEAKLAEAPLRLRPGMKGVGKIEIERRRLIWIWTRPLLDWLRLWTWRWLP